MLNWRMRLLMLLYSSMFSHAFLCVILNFIIYTLRHFMFSLVNVIESILQQSISMLLLLILIEEDNYLPRYSDQFNNLHFCKIQTWVIYPINYTQVCLANRTNLSNYLKVHILSMSIQCFRLRLEQVSPIRESAPTRSCSMRYFIIVIGVVGQTFIKPIGVMFR